MIATESPLLLGIDIGTTGTKCAFYNLQGNVEAHAYEEYPMLHPWEGATEQDPNRWWNAVQQNLRRCFSQQGIDNNRVAAISVSCTNAMTLVDAQGEPLYNAIGHHDLRADAQVEWLQQHVGEELFLRVTANRLAKGTFCLPSLRWLIDHQPELVRRAHKFLMPSGYIIHKLTGQFSMNRPRMSLTSLADIRTGEWSQEIVEKAQIPTHLLPQAYDSCDIVGEVTPQAAELTGLRPGTPVNAGCLDTVAATVAAGAVDVGDLALTIGSCGRVCSISREPLPDSRLLNCLSPFDGMYTLIQSTDNAGISLRWFRDVFGDAVTASAKAAGISVYQYMDQLVERSPAGARGLVYLPYLSGEKAPIWDPNARGVFFNMGLATDYGDFLRAVMEGVAFSLRDCLRLMPESSNTNSPIPLGGGAANSRVWCQIFADVLGRPILQLQSFETETLGAMILAAQSVGIQSVPRTFGKKLAQGGTLLTPNPNHQNIYQQRFTTYQKLYQNLKELF